MSAWRLLWDFRVLKDLAAQLPENSPLGNQCLEVGNEIMNVFRTTDLSSIAKCRKLAEKVLGEGWEALGEKVYDGEPSESFTWGIGKLYYPPLLPGN